MVLIVMLLPRTDTLVEGQVIPVYLGALASLFALMIGNHYWLKYAHAQEQPFLHPSMLILYWVLFWFAIPGLLPLIDNPLPEDLSESLPLDAAFSVWGFILILVGCLVLCVSYAMGTTWLRARPFALQLGKLEARLNITMTIYVLVLGAQLLRIAVTGVAFGATRSNFGIFTPVESWLAYVEGARHLILALVAIKTFRGEWPWYSLFIVSCTQILLSLVSGFMKPLLWIALTLMLAALFARVSLRRWIIPGLVMLVLCVLVVPIVQVLRPSYSNSDFNGLHNAPVLIVTAYQDSWGAGVDIGWQLFLEKVFGRQISVAQVPGIIMQRTPSLIPFQGAAQFLAIPSYLIPRVLWPSKPILSQGVWFSIVYLNQPSNTTSSSAMTVFGEGYIFAGWPGTLFVCCLLGLLLSFLYVNTARAGSVPILLALVPIFIDVEGQFTTILVALIQQGVVLLIIYALLVGFKSSSTVNSA
jgi:hypothetical protein